MKMYRIGIEGGRPAPGSHRRGAGMVLQGHRSDPSRRTASRSTSPPHGDDGGEESEIAGCYVIGDDGTPYRVGLVQGNEFSDHVLETKNYLYLAQSKLRACSIGPELVIDADISEILGEARLERSGSDDLVRQASQRRAMDVPHARQPRTPPLQARRAPLKRATPTCISSAQTCSASRTASGSKTAT